MKDKISVLISEDKIQARLKEMGKQISEDYKGKRIHALGILKGCYVFMADLLRYIDPSIEVSCDFLTISSYGDQTKSSGVVKLLTDLTIPIDHKDILVVEDIVDTGKTMKYLLDNLNTRSPKSVKVCTFLDKPSRREVEVPTDYIGFEIPNQFVVGYGMDAAQIYRNLPYLGVMEEGE